MKVSKSAILPTLCGRYVIFEIRVAFQSETDSFFQAYKSSDMKNHILLSQRGLEEHDYINL